jgi:hypothetical protein
MPLFVFLKKKYDDSGKYRKEYHPGKKAAKPDNQLKTPTPEAR